MSASLPPSTPVTIGTLLTQNAIDKREAEMILANVLGTTRAYVIAHGERTLGEKDTALARQLIARRATGEPIAYLLRKREFYGRDFEVSPATLIPRPETELLVEQALVRLSDEEWLSRRTSARVFDLATGSGIVAISLAAAHPDISVTATDVSAPALEIARKNARRLHVAVEFIESSWYAGLAERRFDLIVSNPPYIAGNDIHLSQGDLRFEPPIALTDGSEDGLDSIRHIIAGAPSHLHAGGWLLLEHGYDQASAVGDLLLKAGFTNLTCIKDLAGIDRVSGGQIR